jgi:NTP pyrophosphatase (non-canonical NTP hydrolase)
MDVRELTARVEGNSQTYAARFDIDRDDDRQILTLHEEVGELTRAHLVRQGQARTRRRIPEQIEAEYRAEVADVLSQVLLLAHHHDIDVVAEIGDGWPYGTSAAPRQPHPDQADRPADQREPRRQLTQDDHEGDHHRPPPSSRAGKVPRLARGIGERPKPKRSPMIPELTREQIMVG